MKTSLRPFPNIRLSENEVSTIIHQLQNSFQEYLRGIYIYGSRTQIDKKGGDIDIWVTLSKPEIFTAKMLRTIHSSLTLSLQEQKIDLKVTSVFESITDNATKAFYNTIKNTMIELWKPTQK